MIRRCAANKMAGMLVAHRWSAALSAAVILTLVAQPSASQPARRHMTGATRALLAFVPEALGGAQATSREAVEAEHVSAAYRTPTGFINLNIAISRSPTFDRAQVRGADSDAVERNEAARLEKQGIAVGRFRALLITYLSGSKTELLMFLGDRISIRLSREGTVPADEMVTLMRTLDLEGIEALALHPARR